MYANLYLSVEVSRRGRRRWAHVLRLGNLGAASITHGLLGGLDLDELDGDEVTPKGLPDDVTTDTLDEDAFTVDDEGDASGLDEVLEHVRFVTRAEAASWVAGGDAQYLDPDTRSRVTDPETYAHSWLSLDETRRLVALCEKHDAGLCHVFRALVAFMAQLEGDGFESRIVYWFS